MVRQVRVTDIRIAWPDLIARVPEHAVHEPGLGCEAVDVIHEVADRVPAQRARRVRTARRDLRDPERLVGVFLVEGCDCGDDRCGIRVVLVDVVRGEEALAVAGGVELIEPGARRIGSDRRDEFGGFAGGGGDEGGDCAGGLSGQHGRSRVSVRVIRFVEGE